MSLCVSMVEARYGLHTLGSGESENDLYGNLNSDGSRFSQREGGASGVAATPNKGPNFPENWTGGAHPEFYL